ncbi:hypothetical protein [Paracoccus benzoatiresistens]|uniref:Uncharacterized protein n=1 Tax=Paracoccus benzoatiresistens TaxID=2997341 RepID=A0ABT4J9L0_9RHOB|nr:hypothetical protein [Paracoccus sp. EF6]MCZ0963594.1 hypothetical protein [Paracoccus sp. EF6]
MAFQNSKPMRSHAAPEEAQDTGQMLHEELAMIAGMTEMPEADLIP